MAGVPNNGHFANCSRPLVAVAHKDPHFIPDSGLSELDCIHHIFALAHSI